MSHVALNPPKWSDAERLREWSRDSVTRAFERDLMRARDEALVALRRACATSVRPEEIRGASVRLETIEEILGAVKSTGKVKDEPDSD